MSRRATLRLAPLIAVPAAAAGGLAYTFGLEPAWLSVRRVPVALARLPRAFHGYRVAQISDIHMGDWMDKARLTEVVALVNRQQPDLVAITGDFVTHHPEAYAADLVDSLRTLRARDGVVAVLGNHDHWTDAGLVRRLLRDSGIVDVSNDVRTLRRGTEALHVAGVDDVWEQQHRLDQVLEKLPAAGAAVLLAHEPDFADTSAATGRFDLQISGHSHGGQVSVPFHGPPILPPYAHRYPRGLYRVGAMLQYTNPGVGMVRPHVRFNCRPEITLFSFQSPAR